MKKERKAKYTPKITVKVRQMTPEEEIKAEAAIHNFLVELVKLEIKKQNTTAKTDPPS